MEPGATPVESSAETRESEQPSQKILGDWPFCSFLRRAGSAWLNAAAYVSFASRIERRSSVQFEVAEDDDMANARARGGRARRVLGEVDKIRFETRCRNDAGVLSINWGTSEGERGQERTGSKW